jgi:aspartate carbamoyltransferase catalytic subunit
MSINWYNINILRRGGDDSMIKEKINKSGKYAKRRDVEPLVTRLQKERREAKSSMKHMKYMMETFRSQFSKSENDSMVHNCDMMIKKLDGFL